MWAAMAVKNCTLFRATVVQVDLGQYGFLRFWGGDF
jgi:hypothetical protein